MNTIFSHRAISHLAGYFAILFMMLSVKGIAKNSTQLKEGRLLFYGMGDIAYANSKADEGAGTTFTKKMNVPYVLAGGLGYRISNRIYLGLRYEYWNAQREYVLNNLVTTEYLNLWTVGAELGYYTGNPRVYYLYSVGAYYPLVLSVASNRNGDYTTTKKPLTYQARLTLGIKFGSIVALQVEGGYRMMNLGNLSNSNGTFTTGGADFNLSGPFVGVGLAIHF